MSTAFHTVAQAAELLQVRVRQIQGLIRTGELRAVDVSLHSGGKPRWRISDAELQAFQVRRSNKPVPVPSRRKRRRSTNITEYF